MQNCVLKMQAACMTHAESPNMSLQTAANVPLCSSPSNNWVRSGLTGRVGQWSLPQLALGVGEVERCLWDPRSLGPWRLLQLTWYSSSRFSIDPHVGSSTQQECCTIKQCAKAIAVSNSREPLLYSWHHKSAYTHFHLCGLEHCCASPTDIWTSVTIPLGSAHPTMQPQLFRFPQTLARLKFTTV